MELIVKAKSGHVEVRTHRREGQRCDSEFRYVPEGASPTEWMPASSPEGFITEGMALSAAILLGKQVAEDLAPIAAPGRKS
ncbi:hypothetical protein [Ralstonia sp. UNC404CL21Col]|uniref:hypothetical protein n=1 Tax=Ralstonia sp. UNC404CL21Col TaxID=1380362 RepID=UPI0012DFBA66|nr:hypothetical protein [Ralstonia sp. UNC404CL21Col]